MEIPELTLETLVEVTQANAPRFPEKATLTLVGDHGAPVAISFVLGNPSGACKLAPKDQQPTWTTYILALLGIAPAPADADEQAVRDCVMWPAPALLEQMIERWPALSLSLWNVVKRKCGIDGNGLEEVAFGSGLPDAVRDAATKNPTLAIRRFRFRRKTGDRSILCLIEPPRPIAWRFFQDALRDTKSNKWTLVRDMAGAAIKLAYDEGSKVELNVETDVLTPFPGVAVLSTLTLTALAGRAVDVELGGP